MRRPTYEYRCDERLKPKAQGSTRLTYTGLSEGLEHLKIKTRLINERFTSVMGVRHVTGLWARPVIRYRPVTGTDRITTSPARAGTGERVVPTGYPVQQMTRIQKSQNDLVVKD